MKIMKDRTISLKAVLQVLNKYKNEEFASVLKRVFMQLPSVTPQPKIGHWILLDECVNSGYYCSECLKKVVKEGWSNTVKKIKYCPNCGVRMRGDDNEQATD